jgi:hypothetical protein
VTTGEDLVVAVFDALDALHVPFMLSGSLASNFYGVPRATQDADLVLELEGLPIQALAEQLRDTFVVDAQLAFEIVTGSRRVLARARHAPFDVELFGLTDDPHDREPFASQRFVEVPWQGGAGAGVVYWGVMSANRPFIRPIVFIDARS